MIITLQPSRITDRLCDDGEELQMQPYPFAVRADGEVVSTWAHGLRAIGLAQRCDRQQVDLWWRDVVADPQRAVGMYLVTENADGGLAMNVVAIESVTVQVEA